MQMGPRARDRKGKGAPIGVIGFTLEESPQEKQRHERERD